MHTEAINCTFVTIHADARALHACEARRGLLQGRRLDPLHLERESRTTR